MLRDSRDILARLRRDGFELKSVRGSHHRFTHPESSRTVIVVHPKRDLPTGTVRAIYKQAGWTRD
jgi:predicted RNA binding protein YcfA (HicA-like mRNA interferase family)